MFVYGTQNQEYYFGQDTGDVNLILNNFLELVENDPGQMCKFIKCREPVSKNECPEDTQYVENVAQFGCCGACVRYAGETEGCTGSVDELYGGGYGIYNPNSVVLAKRSVATRDATSEIIETNVLQDMWCDYHLACGNGGKCVRDPMSDACREVQLTFDEDILLGDYDRYRDEYRWRPECDEKGYYAPKQCKGSTEEEQTCVCVDKNGISTYGKAFPWQTDLYEDMNCLCSRLYSDRINAGEKSVIQHCKENGNFDPLQCEHDWCLCVNETTGEPLSEVVPQNSITLLPCFNRTTEGSMYLRKCDSEYHAQEELHEILRGHGVNQITSSQLACDPDGSYTGHSCDGATCSCNDKFNNYIVAPSPDGSDCNCARDQKTYSDAGQFYGLVCNSIKPGTYNETQQIGDIIFCVDSDGVRNSPKLRKECYLNLSCEMARRCQTQGYGQCKEVCNPECPEDAYFYSENFKETGDCAV